MARLVRVRVRVRVGVGVSVGVRVRVGVRVGVRVRVRVRVRVGHLQRREQHQLREHAAGGVLCPEPFEGVVAAGAEEADHEVVAEDTHTKVDRAHV